MTSESLGTKIKDARVAAGFTQEQLAPQLGITLATLSRWERGIGKRGIGTEQLLVISALTEQPLAYFLNDEAAA